MNNLVILPGWSRDANSYKKLIASKPSNLEIFIPSYQDLAPYKSMETFDEQMLGFLKRNNLDKINLLGHSLGGALAVYFTAKHPSMIKQLFLVDVKGVVSHSFLEDLGFFLAEHARRSLADNLGALIRIFKHPILNLKLLSVIRKIDIEQDAISLKNPTTILWGKIDLLAPLSEGEKLRQLIKNSKFETVEGMGHDWIITNPKYFWENIVF